jgi:hypothetical protein
MSSSQRRRRRVLPQGPSSLFLHFGRHSAPALLAPRTLCAQAVKLHQTISHAKVSRWPLRATVRLAAQVPLPWAHAAPCGCSGGQRVGARLGLVSPTCTTVELARHRALALIRDSLCGFSGRSGSSTRSTSTSSTNVQSSSVYSLTTTATVHM